MRTRVLTGVLAAAVAGTVLVPAGAALAAPVSVLHAHGLHVSAAAASPSSVTLPKSGTTTVELRARVRSGTDLAKVVVNGANFDPLSMVKLERSAGPDGTYSARLEIPSDARTGEWRFEVEATDTRGRTEGADGSFTVKRAAVAPAPRVVSIRAPKRVTVGVHGAKVRVETRVANGPAKVRIVWDGRPVTLKRVGEEIYGGDLRLSGSIEPGKLRYEVRAYNKAGSKTSAKAGSVAVRKATKIKFAAARKGGSVALKGTLKGVKEYGYAGVKGVRVQILFKQAGTGHYERVKSVVTKRGGVFKLSVPYRATGTWKATFNGNGGYAPKTSRTDRVR